MASVLWQGALPAGTFRVVDRGVQLEPRLVVEVEGPIDAMGSSGWTHFDPIPQSVFEAMLLASGVVA